jgi:hypothetical protein
MVTALGDEVEERVAQPRFHSTRTSIVLVPYGEDERSSLDVHEMMSPEVLSPAESESDEDEGGEEGEESEEEEVYDC